jgi:hypothetical protein
MIFLRPSRQMPDNSSIRIPPLPSRYFPIRVQTYYATLHSFDTRASLNNLEKNKLFPVAQSFQLSYSSELRTTSEPVDLFYFISFIWNEERAMEMFWPSREEPGDEWRELWQYNADLLWGIYKQMIQFWCRNPLRFDDTNEEGNTLFHLICAYLLLLVYFL